MFYLGIVKSMPFYMYLTLYVNLSILKLEVIAVTCEDMLNIKEFKDLKILGGKNGLNREISWVYFADPFMNNDLIDSFQSWVNGGEIIVITARSFITDIEQSLEILELSYKHNLAGVVLDEGLCKKEYIELADKYDFPLIEMPLTLRAIDFSQIMCSRLVREKNNENTLEHILSSILYTGYESEEELMFNALYYGFDLKQPCQIAVYDINDFRNYLNVRNIDSEDDVKKILGFFSKTIKSEFKRAGFKHIMANLRQDNLTLLYYAKYMSKEVIESINSEIQHCINYAYPNLKFSVGIGEVANNIAQIKKSFSQANSAVKLVPVLAENTSVLFFDDLGLYSLLLNINNNNALESFSKRILGPLIDYDAVNNSNLYETFEVYLENNKSITDTSDALFIHRNTLRYRLNKIKSLLNDDLENLDKSVQYILSYKIMKYINTINKK